MKNLKRVVLAVMIAMFTMTSCNKEEIEPENCNCGTIANDGITDGCYWLEIRNSCSNNKKTFCFDQDIWMTNYVGDNFCVLGESNW